MTEQQLQSKILKYLNGLDNCWAFKAESVTRGVPDIICCYKGLFVGIEVKSGNRHATKIQSAIMNKISKAWGYVFTAHDLDFVVDVIKLIDKDNA